MAKFSKNTLTQVSGFDNPIIAGELVYNQQTFWNLVFSTDGTPVDLTDATINAQIIRRQISDLNDTRYGLTFNISDYDPSPDPAPEPVELSITNRDDDGGLFTIVIDESAWDVISTDPQLNIAINDCVAFSGRIKIGFPAVDSTPAQDSIIFLLFLVRSDGVVN